MAEKFRSWVVPVCVGQAWLMTVLYKERMSAYQSLNCGCVNRRTCYYKVIFRIILDSERIPHKFHSSGGLYSNLSRLINTIFGRSLNEFKPDQIYLLSSTYCVRLQNGHQMLGFYNLSLLKTLFKSLLNDFFVAYVANHCTNLSKGQWKPQKLHSRGLNKVWYYSP